MLNGSCRVCMMSPRPAEAGSIQQDCGRDVNIEYTVVQGRVQGAKGEIL